MAEWTPPKTWEPGEALTAPELNTHLRDNMTFLRSGRAAVLGMVSNPSIAVGSVMDAAVGVRGDRNDRRVATVSVP